MYVYVNVYPAAILISDQASGSDLDTEGTTSLRRVFVGELFSSSRLLSSLQAGIQAGGQRLTGAQ